MSTIRFAAVVLTGGASTRMGTDKATLLVDGEPMARRVAAAAVVAGARSVALAGGQAGLDRLGWPVLADEQPGEGPLAGILSGLRWCCEKWLIVLATDLRGPSEDAIAWLAAAAAESSAEVVVPVVDGSPQPLHAAWRRSTLPTVAAVFDGGGRSVRAALDRLDVAWPDPIDTFGPAARPWFADADTPAELGR